MPSTKPVIFLDFDGVIANCHEYLQSERFKVAEKTAEYWRESQPVPMDQAEMLRTWTQFKGMSRIDAEAVARQNRLVEDFDASIVISSTWRLYSPLKELKWYLQFHGLEDTNRIIGVTPSLREGVDYKNTKEKVNRGLEIEAWLLRHLPREQLADTPILILDDDADFGRLLPYHVKTRITEWGFSDNNLLLAQYMLEGQRQPDKAGGKVLEVPNSLWHIVDRNLYYPSKRGK